MKQEYTHLNNVSYKQYDYSQNLFQRCTSKIFWGSTFTVSFMLYLQAIIMIAARRIEFIKNYQNPLK